MKWNLKSIWWTSLAIKILIGCLVPMTLDESYYWVWGKHLQLSYFDHPPMVAWLFALGQTLFGDQAGFSRIPGMVLSHGTIAIWLLILKPYCSTEQRKWFLLLALLSPLMGVGGIILTPDLPLLFFWSLGTYFLLLAQQNPSLKNYTLLGAVLGLGFCSKYHVALYLPFAVVWLISVKAFKAKMIPKLLAGFFVFLIFSLPVLLWNYQNDFISFRFQLNHGLGGGSWQPEWTAMYLIGQILIIFPTVFYLSTKNTKALWGKSEFNKLIIIFAWLPFLFFLYSSFKARVEPNWPIIAFPFFLALSILQARKWTWAKWTLGAWALLVSLALFESSFVFYSKKSSPLKVAEPIRYQGVVQYLKENTNIRPVFGRTFQMASYLSYSLKEPIYKLAGFNRFDFYDMIDKSNPRTEDYYLVVKTNEPLAKVAKKRGDVVLDRNPIDDRFEILKVRMQ